MNRTTRRFILRLVRFQNAVDAAQERASEAYAMDSQFDGGEFSGPAIERDLECDTERLARRFGFANSELAYRAATMLRATTRCPYMGPAPSQFWF